MKKTVILSALFIFVVSCISSAADDKQPLPNHLRNSSPGGGEGGTRWGVSPSEAVPGMDIARWERVSYTAHSGTKAVSFSGLEFIYHGVVTAITPEHVVFQTVKTNKEGLPVGVVESQIPMSEISNWRIGYFAGEGYTDKKTGEVKRFLVPRTGHVFIRYAGGPHDGLPSIMIQATSGEPVRILSTTVVYRDYEGGISHSNDPNALPRAAKPVGGIFTHALERIDKCEAFFI